MKKLLIAPLILGMLTPAVWGVTLTDRNSSLSVDTSSSAGAFDWSVDGVDHVFQQWFWYRIGDTGPEQSLDTLHLVGSKTTDTDSDPGDDVLYLLYDNSTYDNGTLVTPATFEIGVRYTLAGGNFGSATSDVAENIEINNLTSDPVDFHFFQYSNFNLNESADDDTTELVNSNTVRQRDPISVLSETVVTPNASRWEIDLSPNTLEKLEDDDADDLSNATTPLTGDTTWAFQWDFTLAGDGSQLIGKDKNIAQVPEAGSSVLLLGLATTLFGLLNRKSRRS